MGIAAIRDTIALAKHHERKTGHLARLLAESVLARVHGAVQLPADGSVESLLDFVITYIDHVPDFLAAARAITEASHIDQYSAPILQLAEDFFLKPPEIVHGHIGLDELMDEAYLAHRLLEEVNDRFMAKAGIPLLPMDLTMANLVVHNLIGEPFSNELDEAVHFAIERLNAFEHVYESNDFRAYIDAHRGNHWEKELQDWPCLMAQLPVQLRLMNRF